MLSWRMLGLLTIPLALTGYARAQTPMLAETAKVGECFKIELTTTIKGDLKIVRDGKASEIPVDGKSEHIYFEKTLKDQKGMIAKSARRYEKAQNIAKIGSENVNRNLRSERTLVVAQCFNDVHLCYSPGGPFTRSEMEVASEHFDTLHLTGLLPGKEIALGDSWELGNAAVQSFCQFDGLIGHTLKGTFKEVNDGSAVLRIVGDSSGIEAGAQVKLSVDATVLFDLLNHRIVKVNWNQSDERDQGPISPMASLKCTIELKREYLSSEPKELNSAVLVGIPAEDEPPVLLKTLSVKDAKARYTLLHNRDWHIVNQTEDHLIMRLLNRGEFLVQASILPWEKLAPGKKIAVEDFRKAIVESKGWTFEEILDAGQVASEEDRWIYRIVAKGEMDGMKVIQGYYMIVGPQGDHLLATFTSKAGNANKLGTSDVELVNSIEFAKR